MACAKRITVKKCNSRDNKDYYANAFIDGRTPGQWAVGTTIKFGYVRGMNYDYPSLENQKWIIKDVGTCEQTAGYPAPYIQHAPAQTVSPCNSRNIIMNRRSGGLANRFRNYEGNEKGTSKLPLFVFYLIGAGALYYVARKNKWLED